MNLGRLVGGLGAVAAGYTAGKKSFDEQERQKKRDELATKVAEQQLEVGAANLADLKLRQEREAALNSGLSSVGKAGDVTDELSNVNLATQINAGAKEGYKPSEATPEEMAVAQAAYKAAITKPGADQSWREGTSLADASINKRLTDADVARRKAAVYAEHGGLQYADRADAYTDRATKLDIDQLKKDAARITSIEEANALLSDRIPDGKSFAVGADGVYTYGGKPILLEEKGPDGKPVYATSIQGLQKAVEGQLGNPEALQAYADKAYGRQKDALEFKSKEEQKVYDRGQDKIRNDLAARGMKINEGQLGIAYRNADMVAKKFAQEMKGWPAAEAATKLAAEETRLKLILANPKSTPEDIITAQTILDRLTPATITDSPLTGEPIAKKSVWSPTAQGPGVSSAAPAAAKPPAADPRSKEAVKAAASFAAQAPAGSKRGNYTSAGWEVIDPKTNKVIGHVNNQ